MLTPSACTSIDEQLDDIGVHATQTRLVEILDGSELEKIGVKATSIGRTEDWDARLETSAASPNADSRASRTVSRTSLRTSVDRSLLRASRLYLVMRRCARILKNSAGTAHTYALSEEVEAIDIFISHNWVVTRMQKFFCLALHFNLLLALIAALAIVAAMVVALFFEVRLLTVQSVVLPGETTVTHGMCGTLLVTPVFLLVTCFGHELRRLAGFHGCRVFLDKTCIHQTNKFMQRRGILSLSVFLKVSPNMVAIFTNVYLTKLWTAYEIGCFLSLHPANRLSVIPTHLPYVILGVPALTYLYLPLRFFFGVEILIAYVSVLFISICANAVLFRHWARSRENMIEYAANFQLADCTCHCEDDRRVLHKNIILLMQKVGVVDWESSDQDALSAFEGIIRTRISKSIIAAIGPLGLRYLQAVAISFVVNAPSWIELEVGGVLPYSSQKNARYRIYNLVSLTGTILGSYPLYLALLSRWCGLHLYLRGCLREMPFLLLGAGLMLALNLGMTGIGFFIGWPYVMSGAPRSLVALIIYSLSLTLLAVFLFAPFRRN